MPGQPTPSTGIVGVTGTDGKSTTTTLIAHLLRACGHPVGSLTTVAFHDSRQEVPNVTRLTTPHALDLQRLLHTMRQQGATHAAIEASSHGLALHKLTGVWLDVAVLTNLTHEHLDFHGSREAYRAAKATLFRLVEARPPKPYPQVSVLNADDSETAYFRTLAPPGLITFGLSATADVRAEDVTLAADHSSFTVVTSLGRARVRSPLVGVFNVSNVLAALAAVTGLGISLSEAAAAVRSFVGVPGRMQVVSAGQPFTVIVDYAHTPVSLRLVLETLRPLTPGRLIAVFGSAGERDVEKRGLMGAVAAQYADYFIITSEDPRSEDPEESCRAIEQGALAQGSLPGRDYTMSVQREHAFRLAFKQAQPGDTVLLAGKGHEHSIIWGEEHRPWDETAVATAILRDLFG